MGDGAHAVNAWGALHDAMQATARVPFASPRKEQAQLLLDQLFPDGLSFLALSYRDEWFESTRRLRIIEEEGLAEPIAAVTGHPSFLEAVRVAHDAYGDALSITEADSAEEAPSLADGMRELRDAISLYVVQVIAWAQQDGGRHLEEAYQALRPIDAARDAAARAVVSGSDRGSNEQETVETEAPTVSNGSEVTPEQPQGSAEEPQACTETPEAEIPEEGPVSATG